MQVAHGGFVKVFRFFTTVRPPHSGGQGDAGSFVARGVIATPRPRQAVGPLTLTVFARSDSHLPPSFLIIYYSILYKICQVFITIKHIISVYF